MGAGTAAYDDLRRYLDGAAALGGVVSAAEAIVATPDGVLFRHAAGYRVGGERLLAATGARFDAASLTKLWVATLALVLDDQKKEIGERQRLHLGERLERAVAGESKGAGRGLAGGGAEGEEDSATLEDLLRHRAGLPAWTFLPLRLGRRLGDRAELVRYLFELRREGLRTSASSSAVLYSDLDYVLWGLLAEERTGRQWRDLLDSLVCAPLGIGGVGGATRESVQSTAVECRLDNGREVELAKAQGLPLSLSRSFLLGVPQDGNARALLAAGTGIEAAHAGLFVTADQMLALALEWLRPAGLLSSGQVAGALASDGEYGLGWQRWIESGSAAELPRSSFGHTGFTGGSVWIDPEQERVYLLLAHRLASSIDFAPFRREFHRLATAI